jgi:folate-binding protein YgfZ
MTHHPFIARLNERTVLSVAGADARYFLNNVVTADVERLGDGEACYGALLTPQGKILFDFFILASGGRFLLDCATATADGLLQRLSLYKLRAKVELTRETGLGVAVAWDGVPAPVVGVVMFADPRLAGFGERLIGAPDALASMANADAFAYHARRIAAGLADSGDIGSGVVFPHEANLDQLGGVSFSKGCYVGQEVVSRMQHRGTARARMVPVEIKGMAEPGATVMAGERTIGTLLSVAGQEGLALIRLDRAEAARTEGVTLMAGAAPVTPRRPDWAHWTVAADKDG